MAFAVCYLYSIIINHGTYHAHSGQEINSHSSASLIPPTWTPTPYVLRNRFRGADAQYGVFSQLQRRPTEISHFPIQLSRQGRKRKPSVHY